MWRCWETYLDKVQKDQNHFLTTNTCYTKVPLNGMQQHFNNINVARAITRVHFYQSQALCHGTHCRSMSIHSDSNTQNQGKKNKKDSDSKGLDDGLSATNLFPRSSRQLENFNIDESDTQIKTKRNRFKKHDQYLQEDIQKRKIKPPSIRVTSVTFNEGGLSQQETVLCNSIIGQLKKNPNVKPFLEPVNPVELNIPDYFSVITNPMDISTIQRKLRNRAYLTFKQFRDDLTLIWMNSYKYNQKGSDIYYMTTQMDKLSTKLLQKRSAPTATNTIYSNAITPTNSNLGYFGKKQPNSPKAIKKPKAPPASKVPFSQMRMMSTSQKRKLCEQIKNLPKQQLQGVWRIVSENNDSRDLTFDIDKLPIAQLWQLDAYIRERKQLSQNVQQQPVAVAHKSQESSSFMVDSDSDK